MSEAENILLPEQVVWGLVGAKVRLLRPTSCANAPWWFSSLFLLCEEEFLLKKRKVVVVPGTKSKGETRTGRHFLNAGRLSESAGEQMSEADNFLLPEQVVWGLVGAKVRLPRPTNCANAPWWFSLSD